jgi:hypothetical protein
MGPLRAQALPRTIPRCPSQSYEGSVLRTRRFPRMPIADMPMLTAYWKASTMNSGVRDVASNVAPAQIRLTQGTALIAVSAPLPRPPAGCAHPDRADPAVDQASAPLRAGRRPHLPAPHRRGSTYCCVDRV